MVAQFALGALLVVSAMPALLRGAWPFGALALAASGLGLGRWAIACNRPGNFNIRPTPKPGGALVQRGPYHWIRHPMYTALAACALACALVLGSVVGWLSWLALAGVLVAKANAEERALLAVFPDYAGYRTRTRRFVPGLY